MARLSLQSGLDCHAGANLSDDKFHNVGVPARSDQPADEGRNAAAIALLTDNPFNSEGAFYEGTVKPPALEPVLLGGFRTPSLCNLTRTAPYGHDGVFATLEDVVDFHLSGFGTDASFVGSIDPKLKKQALSAEDRAALIQALAAAKPKSTGYVFFRRMRALVVGAYYTTPDGFKDIGYIGNVPRTSDPGPSDEVKAHLERELQKLGL